MNQSKDRSILLYGLQYTDALMLSEIKALQDILACESIELLGLKKMISYYWFFFFCMFFFLLKKSQWNQWNTIKLPSEFDSLV